MTHPDGRVRYDERLRRSDQTLFALILKTYVVPACCSTDPEHQLSYQSRRRPERFYRLRFATHGAHLRYVWSESVRKRKQWTLVPHPENPRSRHSLIRLAMKF